MVTIDTHPNHTVSWVDLAAEDVDAAVEFYSGLFGWNTFSDGEMPYTMFLVGEQPVAGVVAISPEMGAMPQVWSAYVQVADIDATLAAVGQAGGQTMQPPFDIPNGGRIAVLSDPVGAALCLIEGMEDNSIKLVDEPGAPCWFDCMSRDLDAATVFYTQVFGWAANEMEGMGYTMFTNNDEPVCGTMAMPEMVPAEVPSHWVVNFVVADADAAAEYTAAHGGTVTMPPTDTPFGRACGLLDPRGATLTVIDRSTATYEV